MEKYYREKNPDFRFFQYHLKDFPAHLHSELELVCILQGSVTAYRNAETYYLTPGDLFLVSPNQVHAFSDSSPDCRGMTLILNSTMLRTCGEILSDEIPHLPVCRAEKGDALLGLLDMAYEEYQTHRDMDVILSMLCALFGILIRTLEFSRESTNSQKTLHTIMAYCAQHYREDIRIDNVCQALFLSRSHISHTFNSKLKLSFTEYINSLRLADAVRLLNEGNYSISQVAGLAGFPTVRTFNRVFQKHYGCTPTQYRK